MAVKKDKRPPLRYLLSADARLKKLSLKKLSEGQKKTAGPRRSMRSHSKAAKAMESLHWPWTATPRTMSLSLVGVIAAASLMAAGQMSQRSGSLGTRMSVASEPRFASAPSPSPARTVAPPPVESPAPAATARPTETARPRATESPKPRVSETAKAGATKAAPAATPLTKETAAPESVTITGCLAKNKDAFSLKDASGADLPKPRSWRTGFFKKGAARVDVVAASPSVKLSDFVGQRVSVTGVLADRQLRARSLRGTASSCN